MGTFSQAGFEDLATGEDEVFGVDGVAVGPSGAAGYHVGCVVAVGERGWEEAGEGVAAGGLPGLVDVAELFDVDAAGAQQLDEAGAAGVEADLEDAVFGVVDHVDAAVLEGAGGVADAFAAGQGAAGAERAALLDGATAAPADAPPAGLTSPARSDPVGETDRDTEKAELSAGEVDKGRHDQLPASRSGFRRSNSPPTHSGGGVEPSGP